MCESSSMPQRTRRTAGRTLRPRSPNAKQLVPVRYRPEVLAWFRATGEGWQARMNRVLRDYVTRPSRRA
ncbi:MAG: BrnA antitoxin family protein [Rhodanobacteraceae bacterium]